MIAILVHNPNYAASTELVKAFSLIGPTDLISLERGHEMYQRDPGHLISGAPDVCRDIVRQAELIVFGDATSFDTLAHLWPMDDWGSALAGKKALALLGDSEYIAKPDHYADICDAYHIRMFAMPGYRPLNMHAIPFHHPFEWDGEVTKPNTPLVMHTPAQENKKHWKGTREIENVIAAVVQDHRFTYERYQELPYKEVLLMKSRAHIFFDQFTPEAKLPCVGRNGCEALALGCVTLSSIYHPDMVKGYFDMPPVVALKDGGQMKEALEYLVKRTPDELVMMGDAGREWAKDNISYKAFIRYIVRHL